MKKKNLGIWFLCNWEEIIACIAIVVMTVVTCAYVLARYLFKYSILWGQEISTICLVYATFVGSAVAYKRNLHYGMDFLTDHLPSKIQYAFKLIINIVLAIMFIFLTYTAIQYTIQSRRLMQVSMIPYKFLNFSAVLGFGSMSIYSVIFVIQGFFKPEKYKKVFLKTIDGQGGEDVI